MYNELLKSLPVPSDDKTGWPWRHDPPLSVYSHLIEWPKISIVTPSYNQGIFLEETLRSILLQNYPNLELIVIDGGSKDNSVEIIKKYEPWITYWISEKDKGQSDAINKGTRKATGEILNWINSDDLLTPGSLKKVAEIFSQQADDVGLIHGGTILFTSKKVLRNDWGVEDPSLERYLAGIAFSQPSSFFLKKYFDMVGGQVSENLHYGMDYDLYCRLACVCKFVPVNDIFTKYRYHDNSKSVAEQHKFIGDWNRSFVNLCKNVKWDDLLSTIKNDNILEQEFFSYHYPFAFLVNEELIDKADKKRVLFYHYCYVLKAAYLAGERKKAREIVILLKKKFSREMLNAEKYIPQILVRLKLPESVLSFIIGLKKNYQNLFAGKQTSK